MISKLANEVYEGWRREGLAPSLEMCVDLNAAGLEMERNTRFYQVTGKCRAREEVRARAATTTTAAAPGARTDRGPTPQGGGQGR